MIARRIIGQMLPKLGFGEQFPTSIRMTRGCLTAQHCHRAQATRSIHVLLPLIILVEAAYFLFLRRSHYDYDAELIFSREARFDFVTPSNRISRATGAICKGYRPTRFPYIYGALRGVHSLTSSVVKRSSSSWSNSISRDIRHDGHSRRDRGRFRDRGEGGLFALGVRPSDVRHRNQFQPGG